MADHPFELPEDLVVVAKHAGWCVVCNTRILVGEEILKRGSTWVHESCAADPIAEAAA